jgi:predicted nucleic acid-binding protein
LTRLLVDTGPLVAIVDGDDRDHARCVAELKRLADPLMTTWAVMTEASYVLQHTTNPAASQDALLATLESQTLVIAELTSQDVPRLRALMHKYRDLPMDFGDATLVRVAERTGIRRIFTLDRRHFNMYRIGRRDRFAVVP